MVRGGRLRGAAAVAFVVALLALLAGCISEPSGGPVISYSMTQGPGGQSQPLPQIIAQPPQADWTTPEQIVRGFLAASASFAGGQRIAREYLTAKREPRLDAELVGDTCTAAGPTWVTGGLHRHRLGPGGDGDGQRLGAGVPYRDRRLPGPLRIGDGRSARRAADFPPAEGGRPVADLQGAPVPAAHELLVPVRLSAAEPVLLRSHRQPPGARPGVRAVAGDHRQPDGRAGVRPHSPARRLALPGGHEYLFSRGRRPRSATSR